MTGLRAPPKSAAPGRVVSRLLVLLLLLIVVAVTIWAAVTNQRIPLVEDTSYEDVEIDGSTQVGDLNIHVQHDGLGEHPVILLHDFDVSGGILWDAVVDELGPDVTAVRIDLPGFGKSSRIPEEDPAHTVAAMAEVVAEIVTQRFRDRPVVFMGVGLGGEVAAEIAVTRPGMVQGLVMIDVDFFQGDTWLSRLERVPFLGPAVTFTFEGAGSLSRQTWAPKCDAGGWCPSPSQSDVRRTVERIMSTTESLRAHRRTPASSLVPSRLDEVTAPAVFIWSTDGTVPAESVERVEDLVPMIDVVELSVWKAHLDDPDAVAAAALSLLP